MNYEQYELLRKTASVIATLGLYSVLYKENKFYRLFEHIFLGVAAGWTVVALWTETLKAAWWEKMIGTEAASGSPATDGFFAYILLLPIGLMGYFVFTKKYNWMSRIPIGIILGLWSGQQVQIWWNTYGPQIDATLKPIVPTTWESVIMPSTAGLSQEELAQVQSQIYLSQAINNFLFVTTVVCVLSYFLFSFNAQNKALQRANLLGRYLLMIGFGAIFGSTVMTRFTLLIDRMYFVWIEWFRDGILPLFSSR
jgi:hypothetical protein